MSIKTLTEISNILKKHETELRKRYGIKPRIGKHIYLWPS
ncbi:hypothetical protein C5S35_08650 [Candidatus Methanophagaceae archaeon]|nr:hypothetical protein C5S35_08650 [Methanophagales archaeon]